MKIRPLFPSRSGVAPLERDFLFSAVIRLPPEDIGSTLRRNAQLFQKFRDINVISWPAPDTWYGAIAAAFAQKILTEASCFASLRNFLERRHGLALCHVTFPLSEPQSLELLPRPFRVSPRAVLSEAVGIVYYPQPQELLLLPRVQRRSVLPLDERPNLPNKKPPFRIDSRLQSCYDYSSSSRTCQLIIHIYYFDS